MKKSNDKKGFTLSEVLITLGIVGVVAVLTIPGVMKNYKNRLYTAQLQKIYSQISDAAQAIMSDEHVDNFYESKAGGANTCTDLDKGICTSGVGYLFNNYLKPIKRNCSTGTDLCIAGVAENSYTTLNATAAGAIDGYCIQTTNGATVCGSYNDTNGVLSLITDVNGPSTPNIVGRDVFAMDVKSDGTIADYGSNSVDPTVQIAKKVCDSPSTGTIYEKASGCLTSVIEAGWKMVY